MKVAEMKAILNESYYKYLKTLLPHKFQKVNDDKVTTVQFRPQDVKLRYSERFRELIYRDKEDNIVTMPLSTRDEMDKMIALLDTVGLSHTPAWVKEHQDFIYDIDGEQYSLSLQHIPGRAKFLSASIITDEPARHMTVIKKLLTGLGCEPLTPEEFRDRMR